MTCFMPENPFWGQFFTSLFCTFAICSCRLNFGQNDFSIKLCFSCFSFILSTFSVLFSPSFSGIAQYTCRLKKLPLTYSTLIWSSCFLLKSLTTNKQTTKFLSANFQKMLYPSYIMLRI